MMEFMQDVNWPVAIIVALVIGIPLIAWLNRVFSWRDGGEW